MATDAGSPASPVRWIRPALLGVVLLAAVVVAVLVGLVGEGTSLGGLTIGERLADLRSERAGLQARADAEWRLDLLPAFRTAGLMLDALAARAEGDGDRSFDRLAPGLRRTFEELDLLNASLREAVDRQTEGARAAAKQAGQRATQALDRLVADEMPTVLLYTPGFVPPRRASGDLVLPAPRKATAPTGPLTLDRTEAPATRATQATPRYVPPFTEGASEEPAVVVEIAGAHLSSAAGPPVLSIGGWRGLAQVEAGRLRFSVPRAAFPAETARTAFALATLSLRRGARTVAFQLLFTVLPDKPGSFALDQKVRTVTAESNTLVSPEILARAPVGETRTVRRCFDPPTGWRFDKDRMRIVIVERLGWQDDVSDPTLNAGSVDFVPPDQPSQVCLSVVAKPAVKTARTATIGRFEATLLRDKATDAVVRSGVRALDWNESIRVPIEPGMTEWKLYVRQFDAIDREFDGAAGTEKTVTLPFLAISPDEDGRSLVLRADPSIGP